MNLKSKKIDIILGDDIALPQKKIDFTHHLEVFEPVLQELRQKTAERLAKNHLNSWLGTGKNWWDELDNTNTTEFSYLSVWREKEKKGIGSLFSEPNNSEKSFEKFLAIKKKISSDNCLSEIKINIANNAENIKESFQISKKYFWNIESHDFYCEMAARFSKILINLTATDYSFLLSFAQYDEQGLLLLCHKLLYITLKSVLASQIIIGLYNPGAFLSFISKAIVGAQTASKVWKISTIPSILTTCRSTKLKLVGFTGLTLGVTLYSSSFWGSSAVVSNMPSYCGFPNIYGEYVNALRSYGSMLAFEIAKTLSTLSNAAIAGFIEPKEEVLKNLITQWKKGIYKW